MNYLELKNKLLNNSLKNILSVILGNGFGSILNILNIGLLVKILGLEKNGMIFLAINYSSMFDSLFNFQSYQAIIKFLPEDLENKKGKGINYIYQAIFMDIITSILSFIIAYILLDKISLYFNWNLTQKIMTKIALLTILLNIKSAATGILRVYENFKEIAYLSLVVPIICLISNYYLFLEKNVKIEYFLWIIVISNLILLCLTWFFAIRTLHQKMKFNKGLKKIKFEKIFLKFLLGTNIISTLDLPIYYLTPFVITNFLGFSDLAVFKILEKLGNTIKMFTSVISQVLSSDISKKLINQNKKEAYRLVENTGKIILFFSCWGILIFIFSYKYWLKYFIPNYDEYMYEIYLFIFYVIGTQVFILIHPLFIYLGFIKKNIIILFYSNILYIVFLYFFTKKYGLKGTILALIVQALLIILSKIIILKKELEEVK